MPGSGGGWENKAACRGLSSDPWFELENARSRGVQATMSNVTYAKGVCSRCPVQEKCLEASRGHDGIWGGMTAMERRKMFRERRALG